MLIGTAENLINSNLEVDNWNIEYKMDDEAKSSILLETYDGKIPIEKIENQKYLGFYL